MKCVVALDLPLLTAVDCVVPKLAYHRLLEASDVLHEVNAGKAGLLFREAIHSLLSKNTSFPDLFWKEFSNTSLVKYEDDADVKAIAVSPDVTKAGLGQNEEVEMKTQVVALHKQDADTDTAYIIDKARGFVKNRVLKTEIGAANREHDLVNVNGGADVKKYFDQFRPKLVQLKHHQFAYKIGGKAVSPFSAFDANDSTAAEALLAKALDDFDGTYTHKTPPDVLYTWDAANKCYVCFHHSGNWEYHGHDLQAPYADVPERVKNKYHIWK